MESGYPPVFILASERSGTNLLRKRISENQKVYYGPQPAHFLKHLYHTQPFYGDLNDIDNFRALVRDALGLCYYHFAPWKIEIKSEDILEIYDNHYYRRNIFGLMDLLMNIYAQRQGYYTYLCKDNNLYSYIYPLKYHLPTSLFIYLYRDPRDVVLSQLKRKTQTDSVYDLAIKWKNEQLESFQAFQPEFSKHVYPLSYEKLISDEEQQLIQLFAFLGIDKEQITKQELTESDTTHEWQNLNRPTITKNTRKFREELSVSKIKIIEQICDDEMEFLYYKPVFPQSNPSKYRLITDWFIGNATYAFRIFFYRLFKKRAPVDIEKAKRLEYIKKFKRIKT